MNQKTQKLRVAFLLCLILTSIYAQQGTTTTGGTAAGSGGTLNYSVGQGFYTANNGSQGSLTQGVQQSYLITVVLNSAEAVGLNINLTAYPNPTTDYLNLKVENYKTENLFYQLFDFNGRLLQHKKIEGNETRIDMRSFPRSTYILILIESNKRIKTFQIIKTESL